MMDIAVFVVLTVVVIYQGILLHANQKQATAERVELMQQHSAERSQLLDRIQAPSFDNLKHHEVKVIKAQQPNDDEPKFEYV